MGLFMQFPKGPTLPYQAYVNKQVRDVRDKWQSSIAQRSEKNSTFA